MDSKVSDINVITLAAQMIAPPYLGGWGFPALIDMITKEKTDHMRPLNMFVQRLANIPESSASIPEVKQLVGACYLADMRNPSVYSFMVAPQIPTFRGVDDPDASLRRALRNLLKSGAFCKEVTVAFEVDSNEKVIAAIWALIRSCTWDPAILENFGTVRPLAANIKLMVKLISCDASRKLLNPRVLAMCRRHTRRSNKLAVTQIFRRA